MTHKRKYFTKALLIEAAQKADDWNFNRQLDLRGVGAIPDFNFPVIFTMEHQHRHGVKCEPHMRCMVTIVFDEKGENSTSAFVDVPMEFYNNLPEAEVDRPIPHLEE